ncbi:MAG: outer membrane protein assembly factor BamA [Acidobacteriota bacterium]
MISSAHRTSPAPASAPASRPWDRPRILALALALVLSAGLLPSPGQAQGGRYAGLQIQGIALEGLETLSRETALYYLFGASGGEGYALDEEDLNERIEALWQRELIDDVAVLAEPVDGGVQLTIRLVERPILSGIEFQGLDRADRGEIETLIDAERLEVYEGQPLKRGELPRLRDAIQGFYGEKGFRFAEASWVLEDAGAGRKRVIFSVDPGDQVKIGDIEFDGNTVYGDWRLRLVMKDTKQSNLISNLTKSDIYNPATLDEDLDRLRELYRDAGYKDVQIARPEIDVVSKNPEAATPSEQKRRLRLTIPIEEGERWKFGEVSIEGNSVFSDELLLAQFERPRGGWLRQKGVDEAVQSISDLYSSVGYIFARVNAEVVEAEAAQGGPERRPRAHVVVRVDEADQFKVGRIEFEGNRKTLDKVLRRELLLQEGRVMSMTAVRSSLLKVRQLEYFALDEEEPVRFDFDADTKEVDLLIRGEEAERTELQFGGGWSEVDDFFGSFSMRTTNFLGRGETLGASIQAGRRRESYDLEYRIPWLFDRPQSLGARVFSVSTDIDITDVDRIQEDATGASLTYGRSFRGFQSLSLTYSFSDVDGQRSLVDSETGDLLTARDVFKTSILRPFWIRNTLDSRFEPTRGLRTQASVELAGGFLGGDSQLIRPQVELTWFKPVSRQRFRSFFGLNLELGYLEPLGTPTTEDPLIFPQQRFFLGGDDSIRGFGRRSIVVRNEDGSFRRDGAFPAGGNAKFQLNLEYHVQIGKPFRAVLFTDVGGVFDTRGDFGPAQSIDPDLLRYSAGVELRVRVPIFPAPLRFIYARNLDPLPNDEFDSFNFSLSTSF